MANEGVDLTVFITMAIVFIVITLLLGWYGHKNTQDNDSYLLGRKKTNSVIIALSYGATFLSASAVIGFGGQAAVHGATLMWLCFLNMSVGLIVAFIVFGRPTRRLGKKLGALTFADLLGKIYKSRGIRLFTALLIIIMMPIYCAAVLKGGVNSLAVITGLDYNVMLLILSVIVAVYVVYGGVIAVMYNDAFQAVIMFVGMVVIFIVTMSSVGLDGFQQLTDLKVSGALEQTGVLPGANGWTMFAELGSDEWLTVVTTFLLGVGIGALTQPQLVVRFMSAKDEKTLNRSMIIGSIFIFVIVGSAYTCGTLCNLYFYNEYGVNAVTYVTNGVDFIIPTFIVEVFRNITFGDVFVSLFLVSLICASISTISGLMHTIGVARGYDLYESYKERKHKEELKKSSLWYSRVFTVIMMVLVVIYCYLMPSDIIAKATSVFMGITAAALLPTYIYGLYAKNPIKKAAHISIVTGTLTYLFWALFINAGTSIFLPICNLITGQKVLFVGSSVSFVDALVVALPVSILAMVISVLYYRAKSTTETEPVAEAQA